MKSNLKNQNGFTLIELLIALVIFAVGILGVATMQITSIQGNSKSRFISESSNVAADQIEQIISLSYSDATLSDGGGTNDGVAGLDDLSPSDGALDTDGDGTNDIFWNIVDDYPVDYSKTIRIIVNTPGGSNPVTLNFVKYDDLNI